MTEGSIHWLTPWYAVFPFLLGALAYVFVRYRGGHLHLQSQIIFPKHVFKHPLYALISGLVPQTQKHQNKARRWLQMLLWGWVAMLSAIALAQPVRIGEKLPDLPPERDIVMLVDTSISMTLKDYVYQGEKVSRLDVLKSLLNDFVAGLQGERLAVIVFAEKPYLLVPLTRDRSLLQNQLQRLTTTMAGRVSALGDAITLALKEAARNPQRQQIFVLFTDVDQSIGRVTPEAAAELAKQSAIPLYSIAIGSTAKTITDANKNNSGLLYQPVNLGLLQKISHISAGNSYQASDASAIEEALTAIRQRQKNKAEQQARFIKKALYFYALLAAILPLMLFQLFAFLQQSGSTKTV